MSAQSPRKIYSLPLFPLHYVLFPQFILRLNVFEERYRVMINRCIERSEPFGVVLIREGAEVGEPAVPHDVGCVARILAVERHEDGRIHLLAEGESRFRLLDYVEAELPYLIGQVEAVEDTAIIAEDTEAFLEEGTALFHRYLTLLTERAHVALPQIKLPEDPTALAFCVASVMQLPPLVKQRLLEMTDARSRLQEEIGMLRAQVEELEALRVREAASSPTDTEEVSEARIMVAKPLENDPESWRDYHHRGRN